MLLLIIFFIIHELHLVVQRQVLVQPVVILSTVNGTVIESDNNMRLGVANNLCSSNINIVQLSLLSFVMFMVMMIFILAFFVTTNTTCCGRK